MVTARESEAEAMTHSHQFDAVSGWCARCGYRDDGRLLDLRTAREFRPPRPTMPEGDKTA